MCHPVGAAAAAGLSDKPTREALRDSLFLLMGGYPIASAMMSRAALERCIRLLCRQHDCWPEVKQAKRNGSQAYTGNLKTAGVFTTGDVRKANALYSGLSQVIHCELEDGDGSSAEATETLFGDVERFVGRFVDLNPEGGVA